MKASDVIALAGIALTLGTTIVNLVFSIKMSKRADYISRLTDFRLRWIDNARKPISEYLSSIDKLQRCDSAQIKTEYDLFLERHWVLQTCLTDFSPKDKEARELMERIYTWAESYSKNTTKNREKASKKIPSTLLSEASHTLRGLMDQSWLDAKEEIENKQKRSKKKQNNLKEKNNKKIMSKKQKKNGNGAFKRQ